MISANIGKLCENVDLSTSSNSPHINFACTSVML